MGDDWRVNSPRTETEVVSSHATGVARAPVVEASAFFALTAEQKQSQFLDSTAWLKLLDLVANAGLLRKMPPPPQSARDLESSVPLEPASSAYEVDVERTVAMLALTAFHDIMKVTPHLSPHLPTSPHISPHLPTSPHISPHIPTSLHKFLYISPPLPTSPSLTLSALR